MIFLGGGEGGEGQKSHSLNQILHKYDSWTFGQNSMIFNFYRFEEKKLIWKAPTYGNQYFSR